MFRFPLVFDKMATICLDFNWLGLQSLDSIRNPDHLQTNPLFNYSKSRLVRISDPHCIWILLCSIRRFNNFRNFKVPSRGCSHQSCEQNSGDANRMLGWHREDMFDKESVKFDHLPKKYKLKDSYKTHPATTGIQPTTWSPALGCKLKYEKKLKLNPT